MQKFFFENCVAEFCVSSVMAGIRPTLRFSHFYANAKTISFLDSFNSPKNDREDSSSDSEDNDMSFSWLKPSANRVKSFPSNLLLHSMPTMENLGPPVDFLRYCCNVVRHFCQTSSTITGDISTRPPPQFFVQCDESTQFANFSVLKQQERSQHDGSSPNSYINKQSHDSLGDWISFHCQTCKCGSDFSFLVKPAINMAEFPILECPKLKSLFNCAYSILIGLLLGSYSMLLRAYKELLEDANGYSICQLNKIPKNVNYEELLLLFQVGPLTVPRNSKNFISHQLSGKKLKDSKEVKPKTSCEKSFTRYDFDERGMIWIRSGKRTKNLEKKSSANIVTLSLINFTDSRVNFSYLDVYEKFVEELRVVDAQVKDVWAKFLFIFVSSVRDIKSSISIDWEIKMIRLWTMHIEKEVTYSREGQIKKFARLTRKKLAVEESPVEFVDTRILDFNLYPFLTEGSAGRPTIPPSSARKTSKPRLWILVHGLDGAGQDMNLWVYWLTAVYSDIIVYVSTANENQNSRGDISHMGLTLAEEIKSFVAENIGANTLLGSVSFLGYSLGGIIARAALQHLPEFQDKFQTFLSLATPHLGIRTPDKFYNIGVWIFKKLSKSIALSQLTLDDEMHIDGWSGPLLIRLCHKGVNFLGKFKHLCFLCSHQDFVTHLTAMIEVKSYSSRDRMDKMAKSLLAGINPSRIVRLDVDFPNRPEGRLNNYLGRWAHVQFLENQELMQMMLFCFAHFFV
eukprot:GHVP01016438.1.p1 GENE.GHVP01016438.1~~GHVP01016438.1.p1  ORF type:complete len:739 (+),score=106.11 GHVP01016438.1:627-2843(+)